MSPLPAGAARSTGAVVDAHTPLGYQLVSDGLVPDRLGSDGVVVGGAAPPTGVRPVGRQSRLDGPVCLSALPGPLSGPALLRPQLAVVLATDVAPQPTPGAAFLAVAGVCLVLEVVDEQETVAAVVVGEQLLEPETDGTVVLYGGRATTVSVPAGSADRVAQLAWLAATNGGLAAGQLVLPVPRRSGAALPAVPGTWQVQGPGSAVLPVRVTP